MVLNKLFSFLQPCFSKVAFFIVFLMLFLSCKEEPLEVGKDILPEEELLGVGIDTLSVELFTVGMGPVYTRDRGISPLGSVFDPVFGVNSAEFVTDFTFGENFNFGNEIDERYFVNLELVIKFSSSYGDNSEINFNVYKLNEEIPHYAYSNYKPEPGMYDPLPLNISSPEPEYGTEVDTSGNTVPTDEIIGYRVFLREDFGKTLLDRTVINDSAYFYDSIFRSYFHGFYFEVEDRSTEGGGLINVSHSSSLLILRLLDTLSTSVVDTVEHPFVLAHPELAGTSINMYRATYSGEINSVLNDTVNDQEFAYLQSLVGPMAMVSIPGLFEKRREYGYRAAVSLAELILPIDTLSYDRDLYRAPNYLGIRDVANDTNIIDDGLLPGYFGGILDTINMEYRFNIGNYVHYFLRDSLSMTDERLYVFPGSYLSVSGYPSDITFFSLTTPGRVLLNSVNSERKPTLRIIYSKLP